MGAHPVVRSRRPGGVDSATLEQKIVMYTVDGAGICVV